MSTANAVPQASHATSSRLERAPAYYYQITSYKRPVPGLCLDEPEEPEGPFNTPQERDDAFREEAGRRDFETSETAAVSFFKVDDGKLYLERSFIASPHLDGDPIPPPEDGGEGEVNEGEGD